MKTIEGRTINGKDDHWIVSCPECGKTYEYIGFFDPDDITKCNCGCEFKTNKVWINDEYYII